jgi:dolichol-phosphate mannosyltransferase
MKLSVVIPAKNEEGCVEETVTGIVAALTAAQIPYEILIVDDGCTDSTVPVIERLQGRLAGLRLITNTGRHGFGMAVRAGLQHVSGDAVAVMMADSSDSPHDLVAYYNKLSEGYECVFGSRFIAGSKVVDYPKHKLILNRLANGFIMTLFGLRCNDITNAFKCYRREVIEGMEPFLSPHFNLTVEMPLKAIVRGYSYAVIPITWSNRKFGVSKLRLKEMGSRYLFIVLYLWLEKHFSRGDYRRQEHPAPAKERAASPNA